MALFAAPRERPSRWVLDRPNVYIDICLGLDHITKLPLWVFRLRCAYGIMLYYYIIAILGRATSLHILNICDQLGL